ncbi:TetR/AcrR family transcriptional regulator [Acetonema longum]|uniref:Transcriptional regulator, TetR family protein n=1 Tax=Acetonema longum DSM 6540 TaxID=1009370 RepID=F7NFI4_9FIRM|nr:TetR/AcrR family transcriptional regulator [Acetonema longum]EGO65183.1 transcriptional regulator, TetR family protein [Acetonema longum DSM 6540]
MSLSHRENTVNKEAKQAKAEGKRAEIVKASIRLFGTRGYDAVSVRDIAKEAGVSEAALYKHFKGKEEMALQLFRRIISEYRAGIEQTAGLNIHSIEKLCRIIDILYDLYDARPAEIRFALASQHTFWDLVEEQYKPHHVIKAIIQQGIEQRELPPEDVYFLLAIYSGLLIQPLAEYPYFGDVLPAIPVLKEQVKQKVRKLFS